MWLMPTSPIPRLSHWLSLMGGKSFIVLIKSETEQTLNHFNREELWQTKRRLVRTRFAVVRHSRTENIAAPRVKVPAKLLKLIAIGMPVSRTGRGTVLTVRVRKSDAESFAKGKLTFDQFEQKATIAAYLGPASHGSSASFRGVSYPSRYPVPPVAR